MEIEYSVEKDAFHHPGIIGWMANYNLMVPPKSAAALEANLLAFTLEPELIIPRTRTILTKPALIQKFEKKATPNASELNDLNQLLRLPETKGAEENVRNILTLLLSEAHKFHFSHIEEDGTRVWHAPTLQVHIAENLKYGDTNLQEEFDANNPVMIAIGTTAKNHKTAGDLGEALVDTFLNYLNLRDKKILKIKEKPLITLSDTREVELSPGEEDILGRNRFPNLAREIPDKTTNSQNGEFFTYKGKRSKTDRKYEGIFHIQAPDATNRDLVILIARKPIAEGSTRFSSKGFLSISPQRQLESI